MNISAQHIRIGEKCSVQSVLHASSPRMEFVVITNKMIAAMNVVASSSKILRAITESVKRLAALWIAYDWKKISLADIVRAAKVSESWLQRYVKQKYQQVPRNVGPQDCSPTKNAW